jgi:Uri superfamily endonuclease
LSDRSLRGAYALFLQLEQDTPIVVGRLGTFCFPTGYYVYVGSALGSGGLSARLARHRRQQKRLHWHIDYLLAHARIIGIQTDASGERLECVWARKWLDTPGVQVIVPGLGASDCGCPAHLIYLGSIEPGRRGMQWNNAQSN